MGICRAFDIFEIIFLVAWFSFYALVLCMTLFKAKESISRFKTNATIKGVLKDVVIIAVFVCIGLGAYYTYMYIKSMFC